MKISFRLSLAVLCAIALSGCSNGYSEKRRFSKTGYTDIMLNPTTCEVTFTGNNYITDEKLESYARLRVARLCQEKDYTHFLILSGFHDSGGSDAIASIMDYPSFTDDGDVHDTPISPRYKVIARFFNEPAPHFAINAAACAEEIKDTYGIL